ncbi:putative OLD family ATP-dependent endonuclease [Mycobacteroides abscessus subsp. abscessus]|uniref:ATP-dependent nuclease n=1 Tax=Mycobacteroides abscessus TaxID=36809 RepID=UPI00092C2B22|nr:ATP-dependent endonuclease [Mycobacteroides abscessus]SHQ96738.1 putative OLD family ATP-dependent endonuclease [Mycobacteroides abscessus subsp. abscessus]
MKARRVVIRNFRSLRELDVSLDDYTALIGPNGSGKSSVLYALDWFFSGGGVGIEDVYRDTSTPDVLAIQDDDDRFISVTVTFKDISDEDRERLGKYAIGSQATFRRTWTARDGKEKVVGDATQGPGFAAVRDGKKVTEFRPAYVQLREQFPELPDLGKSPMKDDCVGALDAWESDPENREKLEEVKDVDASHLFGFAGTTTVKQCSQFVLVPASLDMANEAGGTGKNTALNGLIGSLIAAAGEQAHAAWRAKHASALEELESSVQSGVAKSTKGQARRINNQLEQFIPGTSVKFTPSIPPWNPKPDVTVRTDVTVNGLSTDIARHGHGTQRAIMMAILQAMVPNAESTRENHVQQDGETPEEAAARLEQELKLLPSLIVCIEEPEIYQHPVRARTLARVLTDLSQNTNVQVVVATHSPYFVRPEQFTSLRRFGIDGNESILRATSVAAVAATVGADPDSVQRFVTKQLPTEFSEGFFSDGVVLVEGDTDKCVIEAIAERQSRALDALGVSVLQMGGKGNLRIPFAILSALGVPVYVMVDGDSKCSLRSTKYAVGSAEQLSALESHRIQTEEALVWLPGATAAGAAFDQDSQSGDRFTLWGDDIEAELETWPSFVTELEGAGGQMRSKKMAHYRTACLAADLDSMPVAIAACLDSIEHFASNV